MSYDAKVKRATELVKTIKDAEKELADIFGVEAKRGRPRKEDSNGEAKTAEGQTAGT